MKTYAKATVMGNIGSEVVMRHTKGGKPVVNLSIATNQRRKDGLEVTTWHRAVLWDKLAEYAGAQLQKGEAVFLEGRLSANDWVDQQGIRRTRTEIIGYELIRLRPQAGAPEALPDDLPMAVSRSARAEAGATGGGARQGPGPEHRGLSYAAESADSQFVVVGAGSRADDGEELAEVTEDIPF